MASEKAVIEPSFWRGKTVLLTGHTGFKGAWMTLLLEQLGASVIGVALAPKSTPSLWESIAPQVSCDSHICDITDAAKLDTLLRSVAPDVCIHMAAQALVRESYDAPLDTFSTNIMGTANLLNACRNHSKLKAVLVVTSDKVYRNDNQGVAFKETSMLGGSDPYSASKAASELVVQSYAQSFYDAGNVPLATVRGGNVIGGGDWSADRIVPDIYRAISAGTTLEIRYPNASRPWQHVLDCLGGYLVFAQYLCSNRADKIQALNIGPSEAQYPNVLTLAQLIAEQMTLELKYSVPEAENHKPEKQMLAIDSSLAHDELRWQPVLSMQETIAWTGQWYSAFMQGEDAHTLCVNQVRDFMGRGGSHAKG